MSFAALIVAALAIGCGTPRTAGGIDATDSAGGLGDGDDGGGGDDGAVDAPPTPVCPNWCRETAPAGTGRLYAVHAVSAGDVFAVGDGGTILRRHDTAWTALPSGTTHNLRGVWGASASDVWAVGEAGTVLHFTGSTWDPVPGVSTTDINAIWGSGPSDIWAVGPSRVFHYNGTAWSSITIVGALLSVSGTGPSDVWIAGETSYTHHYTGSWATVIPGTGSTDFYAILAISANNVWATGPVTAKETVNFTGGANWTPHATSAAVFQGLHATSATDVWGVGGTSVGHWNGTSWTIATPPTVTMSLWGVHGSGADVWVVGSGATILHRN